MARNVSQVLARSLFFGGVLFSTLLFCAEPLTEQESVAIEFFENYAEKFQRAANTTLDEIPNPIKKDDDYSPRLIQLYMGALAELESGVEVLKKKCGEQIEQKQGDKIAEAELKKLEAYKSELNAYKEKFFKKVSKLVPLYTLDFYEGSKGVWSGPMFVGVVLDRVMRADWNALSEADRKAKVPSQHTSLKLIGYYKGESGERFRSTRSRLGIEGAPAHRVK